MISTVSLNVGGNLLIVSKTVTSDLWNAAEEQWMSFDNWLNVHKLETTEVYDEETKQKNKQKRKDVEFCSSWGDQRRWLLFYGVKVETFNEEKKFHDLAEKYNFFEIANEA